MVMAYLAPFVLAWLALFSLDDENMPGHFNASFLAPRHLYTFVLTAHGIVIYKLLLGVAPVEDIFTDPVGLLALIT